MNTSALVQALAQFQMHLKEKLNEPIKLDTIHAFAVTQALIFQAILGEETVEGDSGDSN